LLNLDGDANDRVMCFRFLDINSIPVSIVKKLSCVLGAADHKIIKTFPPLKDQKLSDKLKDIIY